MINIGVLYPEELNLYGESGNIKALAFALKNNNKKYQINYIHKEDNINFQNFDFIYIGSGTKNNLETITKRLETYKEDILEYINNDKIFLVTGNAISIFEFLDFYKVTYFSKRQVADVKATTSLCNGIIKAFQNTEYLISSTKNVLFNIEEGIGNNNTYLEGYQFHNFYATSLIGPILALNDELTAYFVNILSTNK